MRYTDREKIRHGLLRWKLRHTVFFDREWYTARNHLSGAADPYEHYLQGGWKTSDPSTFFSNERYLEENPDVREKGICPLEHYLLHGKKEKRRLFRGQVPGKRWRFSADSLAEMIPGKAPAEPEAHPDRRAQNPEDILISVVIPTYNREKTIADACRSVLNQTHRNLECIVVDDFSADDTEAVVRGLGDPRVRYLKHPTNLGACRARNTGIEAARGAYISFQDSDDLWEPQKLELQLRALQESGCDVCFCGYTRMEENGMEIRGPSCYFRKGEQNRLETVFGIGTQTLLIRREVLQQSQFDPEMPRFQDLELLLRLADRFRFYYVDLSLVIYRPGNDSISRSTERLKGACLLLKEKHPELKKRFPLLCRELALYLLFEAGREKDDLQRRELIKIAFLLDDSLAVRKEARRGSAGSEA